MKHFSVYLKEFVVITISIIIAFWVENYRESRRSEADAEALFAVIHSQVIRQEGYLKFLSDYADKHSKRFDSLVTDLEDGRIEQKQLLADISIAYLPYISDIGDNSGIESLKNSGLLSSIKDDTVVHELYFLNVQAKGLLSRYDDAWKRCQERLRNAVTPLYGANVRYDFRQSRMIVSGEEPLVASGTIARQIQFELIGWITLMKQNQVFLDNLRTQFRDARKQYWQDSVALPNDTLPYASR